MSKIPSKKHTQEELANLRARSAMEVANGAIVETYQKQLASKFVVVLGYALPLIAPLWALLEKVSDSRGCEMSDIFVMAVPILCAFALVIWIVLKRALSRHHAAFIAILCLFCSFPIVHAVNSVTHIKSELRAYLGDDAGSTNMPAQVDEGEQKPEMDPAEVRAQLKLELERLKREREERELSE